MGVPTSEVGYIPALPRREDHEVHKDMWWHWKKIYVPKFSLNSNFFKCCFVVRIVSASKKEHAVHLSLQFSMNQPFPLSVVFECEMTIHSVT